MLLNLFAVLGFSFLLGMRHATDADHVVAVTTILTRQKRGILSSAIVGMLWGIGHSITVTLLGIPIILYSLTIPPELGTALEFIVGLMLVILGILNLGGVSSRINQKFTPLIIHEHPHIEELHRMGLFQIVRPVIIGFIHGLAGSAAITLLILATIQNQALAIIYLLVFHTGVIGGMLIITMLIGASIIAAKRKSAAVNYYLINISGILSLLLGFYIMYQAGLNISG